MPPVDLPETTPNYLLSSGLSEAEGNVHTAPTNLILAFTHIVVTAQGVAWNPSIVNLCAERNIFAKCVTRANTQGLIGKLASAIRPGVATEAKRGRRRKRKFRRHLEITAQSEQIIESGYIVAARVGIVPVDARARNHVLILIRDRRV